MWILQNIVIAKDPLVKLLLYHLVKFMELWLSFMKFCGFLMYLIVTDPWHESVQKSWHFPKHLWIMFVQGSPASFLSSPQTGVDTCPPPCEHVVKRSKLHPLWAGTPWFVLGPHGPMPLSTMACFPPVSKANVTAIPKTLCVPNVLMAYVLPLISALRPCVWGFSVGSLSLVARANLLKSLQEERWVFQ